MARPSNATKSRRQSKKTKKGGKAGCQGNFHGQRASFMAEYFPDFIKVRGKARALQNKFWKKCFDAYWARFPWNVPLDCDPDPSSPPPTEETPEILEQKKLIIKLTQNRIKAHMRYRAVAASRKEQNPWTNIVNELLAQFEASPAPRKLPLWQFYMGKNADRIDQKFQETWPAAGLADKDKLAFRGGIARDLLELESDEYRKSLQDELDAVHALEMEEYEQAEKAEVPADEELRQRARDNFALIMQPLLEVMRQHTGYYIQVLAGVPLVEGEKDFDLKAVHSGKASGARSWHGVEGRHFQQEVMPSFTRFLMATQEYEQRLAHLAQVAPGTLTAMATATPSDLSNAITPESATARTSETLTTTRNAAGKSKTSQRKGRGKNTSANKGSDSDSASSSDSESDSESDSDEDEDEEDEDEEDKDKDEGEGEGEGEEDEGAEDGGAEDGGAELSAPQVPQGAKIPDPKELGFNDAMVRKIAAMEEPERSVFLWCHRHTSEYEVLCLNQRAHNAELLAALGVESNVLAMKPVKTSKKATKRKNITPSTSPSQDVAQPARRSARLQPSSSSEPVSTSTTHPTSSTTIGDSNAPVQSANNEESHITIPISPRNDNHEHSPTQVRAFGNDITGPAASAFNMPVLASLDAQPPSGSRGAASDVVVDEASVPSWVREAYRYLTSQGHGEEFTRLSGQWVKLEAAYDWSSSKKGLGTKYRPEAVATWLRYGRKFDKAPELGPEDKYAASWWSWWSGLQPSWRQTDSSTGHLLAEGKGDWDILRHPGKNGLLMVMLSLCWWRSIATDATMSSWTAAMHDVQWTISQLAAPQTKTGKHRADDGNLQADTRPSKRSRR